MLEGALRELEAIVGQPLQIDELAPLLRQFDIPALTPNRFEAWRELAMANNPELKSRHHALDVAEYEVERKRAGHMPKVSLYASSRQTRSDSESSYNQKYDTNTVGIQVSLPLFAGGGVSASNLTDTTVTVGRRGHHATKELPELRGSAWWWGARGAGAGVLRGGLPARAKVRAGWCDYRLLRRGILRMQAGHRGNEPWHR